MKLCQDCFEEIDDAIVKCVKCYDKLRNCKECKQHFYSKYNTFDYCEICAKKIPCFIIKSSQGDIIDIIPRFKCLKCNGYSNNKYFCKECRIEEFAKCAECEIKIDVAQIGKMKNYFCGDCSKLHENKTEDEKWVIILSFLEKINKKYGIQL